ncbi:uncharacterized protein [Diadema antillarum]|uniref:uncharacterized protein n=1 Tax=Diadema antillarum TaxID=105358 RepID=UPI003A8B27C1
MKVHLFGAVSSPGCANFGLKKAADDGEQEFGSDAADFIRNDFYVDDGLSSRSSAAEAVKLLEGSKAICGKAGLKLHKIVSNSRDVLKSFPAEERGKSFHELNLDEDPLALERALGIAWCTESDTFQFKFQVQDRPLTRRGVLSTISSIYDPSGFLGPVLLKGKVILQEICRLKLDWDSPMPDVLQAEWRKWLDDIRCVEHLQLPRCYKPSGFGKVKAIKLQYFSDASQEGYGQCSYIRFINEQDKAHCSFVIGKSRVCPLKQVTIPRLELTAATLSAQMSAFLRDELKYHGIQEYYRTGSQVVLGYFKNEAKRFHVFVANRVLQIRNLTDPDAWFHVETANNPADDASRGLSTKQLTTDDRWLKGPEFIWRDGVFHGEPVESVQVSNNDPEVKIAVTMTTAASEKCRAFPDHFETCRLASISSWHWAKKAVARCLQLKSSFRKQAKEVSPDPAGDSKAVMTTPVSVGLLQEAEKLILRSVQEENFQKEMLVLRKMNLTGEITDRQNARIRNNEIKKVSALYRLDPFIDEDGLLRVGGLLDRASMSRDVRHPVILPQKGHITSLLIQDSHNRVDHMGRGMTHNEIRQRGYWIIGGSSVVSHFITQCVACRKMRRSMLQQKMSELPKDRLEPSPPFTYSAVDYF